MLGHEPTSGHYIRVIITYIFLFIAVVAGTILVVFLSKGYRVDLDDQEIVRTSLVRIESSPNALVFVDGDNSNADTPARLNLSEGPRVVQLFADGYVDWYKEMLIEGGQVKWVTYPFLIPEDTSEQTQEFMTLPVGEFYSFDPGGNYLLNGSADEITVTYLDESREAQNISLTDESGVAPGAIEDIVWSENGRTALVQITSAGQANWVVFSVNSLEAENISTQIPVGLAPVGYLNFREGYVLVEQNEGQLSLIDLRDGEIEPVSETATSYGVSATSIVWHEGGESTLSYWDQGELGAIPVLREINDTTELKVSSLLGEVHVGYETDSDVNVIVDALDAPYERRLGALTSLESISPGGRFLLGRDDQRWMSYDLDDFELYEFDQEHDGRSLEWNGAYHLLSLGDGGVKIVEFDGYNTTQLTEASETQSARLSSGKEALYTFQQRAGELVIEQTPLR